MFWLLLAATLSVDAVVVYWLMSNPYRAAAGTLFEALSYSQISLVCIWSLLGTARRAWVAFVPFAATFAVAAVVVLLGSNSLKHAVTVLGIHVTGLLVVLWIIKRTRWWHRGSVRTVADKWQFSLGQLLVVMTVVALLIALLRDSELLQYKLDIEYSVIVGNILLPAAAVLVWRRVPHPMFRLSLVFILAAVIAVWPVMLDYEYWLSTLSSFLIQGAVLWLWLELGPIISHAQVASRDGTSTAAAGRSRR